MLHPELVLVAYALSGVALKTADVLGETGKTWGAFLSAAIAAGLFGVLTAESAVSSALIFGIILGVTASKKVDRPNLVVGLIVTLIFAVCFGAQPPTPWLLITVAVFAFIDEVGHDRRRRQPGGPAVFFQYRLSLKLAMIGLALAAQIPALYLMGFLCFDLCYDGTSYLVKRVGGHRSAAKEP